MLYDSDGNQVRITSERSRRIYALEIRRGELEARIRRADVAITALRAACVEHPDVPEYAQTILSLERRRESDQGLLALVSHALVALNISANATLTTRQRWSQRKKRLRD